MQEEIIVYESINTAGKWFNKKFSLRAEMEIVTGEHACYRLLAFISLKMELHWRSNPVGKVRNNLPFFKESAYKKFTHKN